MGDRHQDLKQQLDLLTTADHGSNGRLERLSDKGRIMIIRVSQTTEIYSVVAFFCVPVVEIALAPCTSQI